MSLYQFTPLAANDLFEIWSYIARHSVEAANRVEESIYEACSLVADAPRLGALREDLTKLRQCFRRSNFIPITSLSTIPKPVL